MRLTPGQRAREVGTQLEDDLAAFLVELRGWFAQTPLADDGSGIDLSDEIAESVTGQLTGFVNVDSAAHKRIFGDRSEDVQVIPDGFKIRLAQVLQRVDSWDEVADAFADEDAVPLLTVHRSKGLEYHTVLRWRLLISSATC